MKWHFLWNCNFSQICTVVALYSRFKIRDAFALNSRLSVTYGQSYLCILRFYFQIGDEIIEVNGKLFQHLTHDEAVNVLKSNTRLTFMVTYIGKVPHSSLVPNRLVNPNVASASGKQLEKSTVVVSNHQQPPMQSWSKPVHHVSDFGICVKCPQLNIIHWMRSILTC